MTSTASVSNSAGDTSWNYADVWDEIAAQRGDATALVHGTRALTWTEFDRAADGVAQWLLDLGVRPHDTVALCLRNCSEYLIAAFGCFKVSATPANTNIRYTEQELESLWSRSTVRAVVHDPERAAVVESVAGRLRSIRGRLGVTSDDGPGAWHEVVGRGSAGQRRSSSRGRSGDDCVVLFTGGTTGIPKGVLWRQDDLFVLLNRTTQRPWRVDAGLTGVRTDLERRVDRGPRLVVAAPLMHGLGMLTAISALTAAGSVTTLTGRGFDARELLDAVERGRATQTTLVGDAMAQPVLDLLESEPGRWPAPALRVILSSGMSWSPTLKKRLIRAWPGVRCVDILGSTEAIGTASSVTAGPVPGGSVGGRDVGSNGTFVLGVDALVVDDDLRPIAPGASHPGRVAVHGRGPVGYVGQASSDTFVRLDGDSWTVTGDWATLEADGTIRLLGRGASVVNTGGEKVFPGEVEDALRRCPGVTDVAVVGVPHERWGEQLVALVHLHEHVELDAEALQKELRSQLAGYKVPRRLFAVTGLRGADGKVDRRALARRAARLITASAHGAIPGGEDHHAGRA